MKILRRPPPPKIALASARRRSSQEAVGFFASLFGSNRTPNSRPAAPVPAAAAPAAEPAPAPPAGTDSISAQAAAGELDLPALLAEARALLDRKDLPAALQIYERIANADEDLGGPFTTISGDLGATGHIDAVIEFLAPRYDPALHGTGPGLNLLQAFIHRRNAHAAQQLLDLLRPLVTTYSLRDRFDGFANAVTELRAAAPAEPAALPREAANDINLINISKPIWTYGLENGENTLPTKNPRVRRIAFLPIALVGEGLKAGEFAAPDHPLAAVVRGLPLALAEACWFAPAYRPIATSGLDPQKNLLLCPRPFRLEQIRQLFPAREEPLDYALAGTVRAAAGGALGGVEFTIWDVRKGKLLKTLALEGADALARAWPLLLGYIEAAKPGPAPLDYALPADPGAHAVALDHVLHFFLVEKGVLAADKLAPHETRLEFLAAHAADHPAAAVPRLALVAALRHCQTLGLAIPPALAASAQLP